MKPLIIFIALALAGCNLQPSLEKGALYDIADDDACGTYEGKSLGRLLIRDLKTGRLRSALRVLKVESCPE